MNANIQKKQSNTFEKQDSNNKVVSNNLNPKISSRQEEKDRRVDIPRSKTSNRPKIVITESDFDESIEEEGEDRRNITHRKEQKEKKENRERPNKKRPKKKKKEQKKEQRPPVATGCFHVCETLIFEVYKLLGGSLCDC